MPRTNPERRRALTDAAIGLLARHGAHGLTHRSVERAADVPAGTAANYFRSRSELLIATAERIVELHLRDADEATRRDAATRTEASPDPAERLADLLADSLLVAATTLRERYLAIFELQLEARRQPELAVALSGLSAQAATLTGRLHADTGFDIPPAAVRILIELYGGALFTLVTGAAEAEPAAVRRLAEAIVAGALAPRAEPPAS